MSKLIYADHKYKILHNYSGYVLINKKGDYKNHGHFKKSDTCFKMMEMIEKQTVPQNSYLQEAALRISTCEKYKRNIRIKQEKDSQKQHFTNIQKGASIVY